jgi:type IV secretory pathway VirB9-like protein
MESNLPPGVSEERMERMEYIEYMEQAAAEADMAAQEGGKVRPVAAETVRPAAAAETVYYDDDDPPHVVEDDDIPLVEDDVLLWKGSSKYMYI